MAQANQLDWKITGEYDYFGRLEGLPIAMRAKGIRYAGRKAANVIQTAAVSNASRIDDPATAEHIAANIVVRFSNKTFKRTGDILFRVGVLGGARDYSAYGEITTGRDASKNPGGDTWYWRLVEFGTEDTAAQPFMRPALENNIQKATNEFGTQLASWLDRNLRRITKKGL
jgi:HK97 gp10 family phage protein